MTYPFLPKRCLNQRLLNKLGSKIFPPSGGEELPIANFDAFLPRGSIVHRLNDNHSVSFTIARGYRVGGSYLYARDNWRAFLFADNLLDDRFIGRMGAYNLTAGIGTVDPSDSPFFAVNDSRVFGIELRYSY